MRGASKAILILTAAVLLPSLAFAQGTLTGTVKDQSGGILPGVTVEASSPALIEKVRTGVTDGAGQYRITGLNPGTYSLTFTLPGFNVVRREGVELGGTATLTIPAEMRVGALAETITVTGETPVVDVQSTQRQAVLSADVIASIPATRAVGSLLNATPGLVVGDTGLNASPTMTFFSSRGGPINEGRMAVNGMTVAAPFNGGGVSTYTLDSVNVDEVSVSVSGGMGESDIGGPVMNLVPRTGGNDFRGQAFFNNAGDWSRGNNLTDELRAVGLTETPGIINAYDASVSYGGPIKRDRLWFFGSYRKLDTVTPVQGVVANANAFNAARWDWVADNGVTARQIQGRTMYIGRFTAQVSDKHRVSFGHEYQNRCEGSPLKAGVDGCNTRGADWVAAGTATVSPEANPNYFNTPYHLTQAVWSAPMTNKLLLEAGFSRFMFRGGTTGSVPPEGIFDLISVTEQSTAINPATGQRYAPRANYVYRGVPMTNTNYANPNMWRASASYVTGSHDLKVGYQGGYIRVNCLQRHSRVAGVLPVQSGVPNQFTFRLPTWRDGGPHVDVGVVYPGQVDARPVDAAGRAALRPRLELQPGGGQRDDADIEVQSRRRLPSSGRPASTRSTTSRRASGVGLRRVRQRQDGAEVQPRPLPRCRDERQRVHEQQPGRLASFATVNRNWGDANNNKVIDCNIMNFAQNGECSALTGNDLNFGKANPTTTVNPAHAHGLGRPSKRLAVGDQRSAGGDPTRVGGGRLQPPVVPRRQSHGQ